MTLCINPRCDKPQNSDNAQFCQNCQSALLLQQRYRATKVLGEGGFGKTYEGADLETLNKVIKVLINNSPKAVELFQREAEVLSQLNNPGIPRVEPNSYIVFHPTNSQEPVHCLVMEKVEGMNLRDYLKQLRHPIDSETAERWLKELVLILQEVHDKGILHRDIKPQNIIFKPDGKLALIDFGAVREGTGTEVATAAGSGGGTEVASHMAGGTSVVSAGYTAPEQMNGQAMRQSDFYSLGRTFIFLLTGKEPSEIFYDAYNDVLQWRKYAPKVEPNLAELLDQMQSTQVKQRPTSAQGLLQSLNSKRTSTVPVTPVLHSTSASPSIPNQKSESRSPTPEPTKRTKRKTSWLAFGGLIVGVSSVVGAIVVSQNRSTQNIPIASNPSVASNCFADVNGNIRSEPSSQGRNATIIASGSTLPVTGIKTAGGWVQIKLSNGTIGWAHLDIIKNVAQLQNCWSQTVSDADFIKSQPVSSNSPNTSIPSSSQTQETLYKDAKYGGKLDACIQDVMTWKNQEWTHDLALNFCVTPLSEIQPE